MTEPQKPTALIVDDEPDFRASLEALVARQGFEVRSAGTLARARQELGSRSADLAIVDLVLPDGSGLDLLGLEEAEGRTDVVVVTGNADVETAVAALRSGAIDYLTKPLDRARLETVLTNVARTRELRRELTGLRAELRELGRFGPMVGRSKPMQEVYDLIARVAPTSATVLLTGESGTGKELAAETIHQLSRRKGAPFLIVNCGAVSPTLIESELFGHERGSFTGAERRRQGYFERASGGTLFLDEITETPIELQVKLLRVLESGHLVRVGGSDRIETDVRIVTATNRSPEGAVREGKLREDLYYRLNVFPIGLPPLRARKDDVALLAEHFLAELNRAEGASKRWTPQAVRRLESLPWPGNVRELRNAVQRAFILADETLGMGELSDIDAAADPAPAAAGGSSLSVEVGTSIADMERRLILATLEQLDSDKKRAASVLGISLKTLYNRLNVYRADSGDPELGS